VLFLWFTLLTISALGQAEGFKRDTAWEVMLSRNPEVVDDNSVSWLDRLVLHVLTLAQAREYYQGADPKSLTLADGTTLADYLAVRFSPPGNVICPTTHTLQAI